MNITPKEMIKEWFDKGVAQNAKFMLVVCDTYDHDDYPVYAMTLEEAWQRYHSPGDMQRVMEVYDLQMDQNAQLNQHRAMNLR